MSRLIANTYTIREGEYALPADVTSSYVPVVAATLLGIGFIAITLFAAGLLAPRMTQQVKSTTYECGMVPIGQGWQHMNVRYYLYAILFLIFEIEAVFLFPWAVMFRRMGPLAFFEMLLFLGVLLFGLAYAWRKGVLKWA